MKTKVFLMNMATGEICFSVKKAKEISRELLLKFPDTYPKCYRWRLIAK